MVYQTGLGCLKLKVDNMVKVKNPIPPTRRPTRRSTVGRRVGHFLNLKRKRCVGGASAVRRRRVGDSFGPYWNIAMLYVPFPN